MGDLVLKKTTTGQITLTPQDVAGNQTVTIPASTGTLSIANTSTSGGIFFGGATSGVLYQDASNLYWDDTNNRLGIGTNAPSNALHVSEASSDFQVRVTGTSAANAGSIRAYNDGGQAIGFGMAGSTNSGYGANVGFLGTITNVPQLFLTNNTERARFLTTGNVLCLSGGSTSANGTGIAFPATQSQSTDVNTLDDYEEGYCTCYFAINTSGTAAYTGTYPYGLVGSGYNASYTKIGRQVTVNCYLNMATSFNYNTGGGAGAGSGLWIAGLPFSEAGSSGTINGTFPAASTGFQIATGWAAGYTEMNIVEPSTTVMRTGYVNGNGMTQVTANYFLTAQASIIFTVSYMTA